MGGVTSIKEKIESKKKEVNDCEHCGGTGEDPNWSDAICEVCDNKALPTAS